MRTLLVPLQIDAKRGLAVTQDPVKIIEQRIIDLLTTFFGERVMQPTHGADLQSFLFSPARDDMLANKADEVKSILNSQVGMGEVVSVTMNVVPGTFSTVRLVVLYRVDVGGEILTMTQFYSGLATEETP